MAKSKNNRAMREVRRENGKTVYTLVDATGYSNSAQSVAESYGEDSHTVYDEDTQTVINKRPIRAGGKEYYYVPFGGNDDLPSVIRNLIYANMVTSQGMFFDITACYGQGLQFVDRDTKEKTSDEKIRGFCLANSIHECWMEQCTDMKLYFFTVTEIILNSALKPDELEIVGIRHLESCYCRFEAAKDGKIEHVFYGDFKNGRTPTNAAAIPLLDRTDPLGDLRVRCGIQADPKTGKRRQPTKERKFAVCCRIPTPGFRYYPIPYYTAIFRDHWYDIYKLIGLGKKQMIKNTSAPRWQIEVHDEYWDKVCDLENINEPSERVKRIKRERQNIIDFVCGVENAGKAMVSGYYIDPNKVECRMVRIVNLAASARKEGGDWSDDMQEASNALCFALGVHPNLIGATPGKSQMNNSGSDKRELFNLKQLLETPFHDIMAKPYHLTLHFNHWSKEHTVSVPMIQMVTLDSNKEFSDTTKNISKDDGNRQEHL